MAAKDSKLALAEAAALLNVDKVEARAYLRRVQLLAGNLPYRVIVEAMKRSDVSDVNVIAALLGEDAAVADT